MTEQGQIIYREIEYDLRQLNEWKNTALKANDMSIILLCEIISDMLIEIERKIK